MPTGAPKWYYRVDLAYFLDRVQPQLNQLLYDDDNIDNLEMWNVVE